MKKTDTPWSKSFIPEIFTNDEAVDATWLDLIPVGSYEMLPTRACSTFVCVFAKRGVVSTTKNGSKRVAPTTRQGMKPFAGSLCFRRISEDPAAIPSSIILLKGFPSEHVREGRKSREPLVGPDFLEFVRVCEAL